MEVLYARYLTSRKRDCFYFGISDPPHFSSIEDHPECTAEQDKNRAQVTLLSQQDKLDFRFYLRSKDGTWRINSLQTRVRTAQRTYQWQYDNF